MNKYTAYCKQCDCLLFDMNQPFCFNLWPHSYNIVICWFCGNVIKTNDDINYKEVKENE
jgi:hypothetical protein